MLVATTIDVKKTHSRFPRWHPLLSHRSRDTAFWGEPGPKALYQTEVCRTARRMGGIFGWWKAMGVQCQVSVVWSRLTPKTLFPVKAKLLRGCEGVTLRSSSREISH